MKCELIFELEAFFRTKNYKRVVLSTSEMQVVAKKMYAKNFHFEEERFHDWHGIIRIHFFAGKRVAVTETKSKLYASPSQMN